MLELWGKYLEQRARNLVALFTEFVSMVQLPTEMAERAGTIGQHVPKPRTIMLKILCSYTSEHSFYNRARLGAATRAMVTAPWATW